MPGHFNHLRGQHRKCSTAIKLKKEITEQMEITEQTEDLKFFRLFRYFGLFRNLSFFTPLAAPLSDQPSSHGEPAGNKLPVILPLTTPRSRHKSAGR